MNNPLFLQEFNRRMTERGYKIIDVEKRGIPSTAVIVDGDQPVAVANSQFLYKYPAVPGATEQVIKVYDEVKEYVTAYENAPPDPRLPEGWKALSAYNSQFVMAAQETEYGMQFTTWRFAADNAGVWSGGDYTFDYSASRREFIERASLKGEDQFTKEEMEAIYRGLTYQAGNFQEIDNLDDVLNKLEEYIPDITQRINEEFSDEEEWGD